MCFYYLQRMVTTLGRRLYRHPLPCKLGCANWLSFTVLSGNENTSQAFALQKCWFFNYFIYEIKAGSVSQTLSHIPFLQFQFHISSRAAIWSPTGIRSLLICLRFKSKCITANISKEWQITCALLLKKFAKRAETSSVTVTLVTKHFDS